MRPSATKQNVPNDVTRGASAAPASSMLPCLRAKRVELETENLCHALSEPKFFPDLFPDLGVAPPRVFVPLRVLLRVWMLRCVPLTGAAGVKGALTSEPSRNTNM